MVGKLVKSHFVATGRLAVHCAGCALASGRRGVASLQIGLAVVGLEFEVEEGYLADEGFGRLVNFVGIGGEVMCGRFVGQAFGNEIL